MFEFQGKTYRIVKDRDTSQVSGCNSCAFHNDDDDCASVDGRGTDREPCYNIGVHYVEVSA